MPTKPKTKTSRKLFFTNGEEACQHRKRLGLTQTEFWSRAEVAQSAGSRYESGRDLPVLVQLLLHLIYAPEKQAQALLSQLRSVERT